MRLSSRSSSSNSTILRKSKTMSVVGLMLICLITIPLTEAANIIVGNDPFNLHWTDGACYLPIKNVRVGDTIEFQFRRHDVYKMNSIEAFNTCDFSPDNAEMLASYGESPYKYTITNEDAQPFPNNEGDNEAPSFRSLYFSCSIGSHCLGKQRVRVDVDIETDSSSLNTRSFQSSPREETPVSKFVLGTDSDSCTRVQNGDSVRILDRFMESSCSEPERNVGDYGRDLWSSSCLSAPFTLTPGGVVNQVTILHYPFPKDHRVVLGRRMWEFVQGDIGDLKPVNVNQLYVHHLLGGIVLGNGAESIRRSEEDAQFHPPYARVTGDFSDRMTFHLIDLRETGDDWLACIECRCAETDDEPSFSFFGGGDEAELSGETGGVSCCTNCTALTTPTVDYRMRYNVTWSDIKKKEPIQVVRGMVADMARALDKNIEWDVPQFNDLPESQRHPEDPTIQLLERVGPMNELFSGSNFADEIPEDMEFVEIHRCTGHMHVGGIESWVINVETGDVICNGKAIYGEDPTADKGFITHITTQEYDPPIVIARNTTVKIMTHYDATVLHTGVMGLITVFYSDHKKEILHQKEAALTANLCESTCDLSLLPDTDSIDVCKDYNFQESVMCTGYNICSCEIFMNIPGVEGCGGDWQTPWGSTIPVDSFCAEHCGCEILNDEEAVKKIMMESITNTFSKEYGKLCRFATDDCERYLSNLYSCQKELNQDNVHPAMWEAMDFQSGTRMALERAKLGNEAIHRFRSEDINKEVLPCSYNSVRDNLGTENGISNGENSSSANVLSSVSAFSFFFTMSILKLMILF